MSEWKARGGGEWERINDRGWMSEDKWEEMNEWDKMNERRKMNDGGWMREGCRGEDEWGMLNEKEDEERRMKEDEWGRMNERRGWIDEDY